MIWQIVKKQGLLLWRNPGQLLLLIGLPILLITILGTALSSMMDGQGPEIKVKVAFIEYEDEKEQVDRFIHDLEIKEWPPEVRQAIQENARQMSPIQLLKESVFGSAELEDMIDVSDAGISDKNTILNDDSYTALIEVPKNFTYDTLQAMILNEGSQPELKVYQNEGSQIGSSVVDNILQQYQKQLTLQTFLGKKGIDQSAIQINEEYIPGEITTINKKDPVSTKSYYAIGMAVMNVLFMASAISGITFLEKKIHVFDRVILANVSRWVYFIGVFLSGAIFALLQLFIVFGFSWALFRVSWPNFSLFLIVTFATAVAVGGISVLLTAINFRLNSEVISNFFSSILVTLMSFLGGSFFPVGDSSKLIQQLGNITPNGAGMSAYMAILRGDGFSEISQHVLFLILFAAVSILFAALSFPKRGASA
jgi:ABC-2 type transport system permease protein